ncbi:MAG: electron transport complex subunit RsxC [Lachnospirales bacterium]
MKTFTFKRGIHPDDSKHTKDMRIETILPRKGSELVYPMLQHIGAPCKPIVKEGEEVLLGQKIADSEAYVSSPIHTTVSGVVKKIEPRVAPNGNRITSVVIENDGEYTELESLNKPKNPNIMTQGEILNEIRDAGIVGLGGAGFPTHVKLNPPKGRIIDYFIVNAAECEPYLTTDYRVLLEETEKIIEGIDIVKRLHPKAKTIIGIETNKLDAIEKLNEVIGDRHDIEVKALKPKYPQGAEKQLIYACTGRVVPSGGLPADIGVIVNNVDTIIAIHRAFKRGRPLMRKVVTLTGDAINRPGNFKIRLGTSLKEVVEDIGGYRGEVYQFIAGGPMMGLASYTTEIPLIKTSSAYIFMSEKSVTIPDERNCMRCGKCVDHCPAGLLPFDLNYYVEQTDMDSFVKYNGLDCIECGSCSYICPSKRHLAQSIRFARRKCLAKRKK